VGTGFGLVLLLPHGYEGAGPEHSSARLERFLQLCAEGNMRVAYPSTPAQYFHILRRQAKQRPRRPLVLMQPKWMLRLPAALSSLSDLSTGGFRAVIDDPGGAEKRETVRRIVCCTGKIYWELMAQPQNAEVAVVRIEELYPWPHADLERIVDAYQNVEQVAWAQEEPKNQERGRTWRHCFACPQELPSRFRTSAEPSERARGGLQVRPRRGAGPDSRRGAQLHVESVGPSSQYGCSLVITDFARFVTIRSALRVLCSALLCLAPLRIAAQASGAAPLARNVLGFGTTVRVLVIGAHPDDEDTGLLAWLALGRKVETGYLSLTRGDGGQNAIGDELGEALGAVRTEEILAARRIDGGRQYFTRAYDFGFSKDSAETLKHWPREDILGDVVKVIRAFRPHVIIAMWTGTPADGHGHHTVAGLLARDAFDAGSDTVRFPIERFGGVWVPSKFYRALRGTPHQERCALTSVNTTLSQDDRSPTSPPRAGRSTSRRGRDDCRSKALNGAISAAKLRASTIKPRRRPRRRSSMASIRHGRG
jgi:LmbE family N-acetylglucosaminyl deacetylase